MLVEISHFKIKDGVIYTRSARPTNQSNPKVLKKISERLKTLIDENPELELTDLQLKFKEEITSKGKISLSGNKIDIAHNIAISNIKKVIAQCANNPMSIAQYDEKWVDAIITTEDDDSKDFINTFFENLRRPDLALEERMKEADKVIDRLNCASKNLIPGHKSTNRSIGSAQDQPLMKDKHTGKFKGPPALLDMTRCYARLFTENKYTPKTRKRDGKTESQSSSISNTPATSWYTVMDDSSSSDSEDINHYEEISDDTDDEALLGIPGRSM